jgi:hypothetical protein
VLGLETLSSQKYQGEGAYVWGIWEVQVLAHLRLLVGWGWGVEAVSTSPLPFLGLGLR